MTLSLLGREIVRHRSPICYSLNMRNPLKHKKTIPFWLLGITAAAYGVLTECCKYTQMCSNISIKVPTACISCKARDVSRYARDS